VEFFPAIDLRAGRCVRLVEGDFDRETVYGDDPIAVAESFAAAGARWIHVVDLDAARTGDPVNRPVVARIAAEVGPAAQIQTGGGVRTVADADSLLAAGVARVVVGTAAVQNPALVAEIGRSWPGRVAVGIDHRNGEVRLKGWTEAAGRQVLDLIEEVTGAGASAVIVTDISRDGRLAGPDLDGLSALLVATTTPIIASGGVGDIDDLRRLAGLRSPEGRDLAGVIAGRAIYEGRLNPADAVAVLSGARAKGG
jgi:phosphoribosylformimino-5-aminoimidazole carboxamide ribotide isomerase